MSGTARPIKKNKKLTIQKKNKKIMETTLTNCVEYTYNRAEIVEKINETIEIIEKEINKNNYQVRGNLNIYKNLSIASLHYLSKNQMKNIQKYCFWIDKKPSLKKMNTFLSLLSKLFGLERVQIKVSLKEESIQNARKRMLVARKLYENLLLEYKTEKGNFYKK